MHDLDNGDVVKLYSGGFVEVDWVVDDETFMDTDGEEQSIDDIEQHYREIETFLGDL